MISKKITFLLLFLVTIGFSQKQTLFLDQDFDTIMQQAKTEKNQ